ncbi:MAG: DUF6883 domain-containing protein [Candidatus Eisenbacteria bacterium]|nr:adhesin [Candidatus Eisenbacteria bacterium]
MKLPNAEAAFVDSAKIRNYLLADTHPIGRFKAAFFASLGYRKATWNELEMDLIALGRSNEAEPDQETAFGRKFRVRGTLRGPSGRGAEIVTIWIILRDEDFPRFITAFPGGTR